MKNLEPVRSAPRANRLAPPAASRRILVLRTPSGISGDMLVTGLARLAQVSDAELAALVDGIGVSALHGALCIRRHSVGSISGWKAEVELPHEHEHRPLSRILQLIESSTLTLGAKRLATDTFNVLASAEAAVHDIEPSQVAFHEVGALDSVLDICMAAALFTQLAPGEFHCSPLPLCDGVIRCEHGPLASPAPAVQEMLQDIPVYGVDSHGETVTPTALAFLKSAGAKFGQWPRLTIRRTVRVYGGRVLPGVPNGAIFTLGNEWTPQRPAAS